MAQGVKKKCLKVIFVKMSFKDRASYCLEMEIFIVGDLLMAFWMGKARYSQKIILLWAKSRKESWKEKAV